MKPSEVSKKLQTSATLRSPQIVSDGCERLRTATTHRLEQALYRKFAAELSDAGFFGRLVIRYRIRRIVQRRVRRLASPYALYASRLRGAV